jgi:hypothetical protein
MEGQCIGMKNELNRRFRPLWDRKLAASRFPPHEVKGRTFCTAAALLTLMADRTPVPVAVPATAASSSSSR